MKTIISILFFCASLLLNAQSVEIKGHITIQTIKQQKNGKIDTLTTDGGRTMINGFNKVEARLISVTEDNGDYFFDIDFKQTPYTHIEFFNIESGRVVVAIKDIKQPFHDVLIVKVDGVIQDIPNKSRFKVDQSKSKEKVPPPIPANGIPMTDKEKKKELKKAKEKKNEKVVPVVEKAVEAEQKEVIKGVEKVSEPAISKAPEAAIVVEDPKPVKTPAVSTEAAQTIYNQLLPEEAETEDAATEETETKLSKKELKAAEKEAKLQKEIEELEKSIKEAEAEKAVQ